MQKENSNVRRIYGYARVSTAEQNLDRQIDALLEYGVGEREIMSDKQSGKNLDRPNYLMLRNQLLRSGDELVVKDLDRLSRNRLDIHKELAYFQEMGVTVRILSLPTTLHDFPSETSHFQTMINALLIEVMATMAEVERETMLKRQQGGIRAARDRGVKFGRPVAQYPDNWEELLSNIEAGNLTVKEAIDRSGLSTTTFYKLRNAYRNNPEIIGDN